MPDAHEARRLRFLTFWAEEAAGRGHRTPPFDELRRIALAGSMPPDSSSSARQWQPTIEYLLKQERMGANDPQDSLPSRLLEPTGEGAPDEQPPPPPPTVPPVPPAPPVLPAASETPEEAVLTALKRWREDAIAREAPGIGQLTETHLRLVARSRKSEADELRATFAPVVRQFADDIAAVVARTLASRTEEAPSAGPVDSPAPASPPATEPSAPVPLATTAPAPSPAIDPASFAPYAYGGSEGVPTPLRVTPGPEGSLRAVWSDADARATAVFRVVSADEHAPYSPDDGHLVAATVETDALDERPFTTAVRHYQVWRNVGRDVRDAVLAQPSLHAFGAVVAPVVDVDVQEDEGRVIGRWRAHGGTTRVQVFRVPRSRGALTVGDPSFRILVDEANLGGFVDRNAVRGEKYLYQVFAEAVIDGVPRLSAPTAVPIDIPNVHEPVLDLAFELHDDADAPFFDLSWTVPPGGDVVIYRTTAPPSAGIEREIVPETVLPQANLSTESRLAHPITTDGTRASMRDVPWPRGWTRAYFTIVVLMDGQAFVGRTVRGVRVPPVAQLRIVERVQNQRITFEWPDGADVVMAYRSPVGLDSALAVQGEPREISKSEYFDRGSLEYRTGGLDPLGCELHLVAVAFDGGKRVLSTARSVVYPGLLRLSYRCVVKRTLMGRYSATVTLTSERALESSPPFVLVHNPERFPLTVGDGTPLAVVPDVDDVVAPTRRFVPAAMAPGSEQPGWRTDPAAWQQDVPHPTGYLRLFVDLPSAVLRRVALLDPPIETLRVQSLKEKVGGFQNRARGG
ncbi:hypothetical protein [Rathayibacter sp. AY1H3]|jgi:hypothetical protein|uniref:hypothetical protein n=1 Tax=Rathayibacter sp. AY1H3 TaxID=2080567 RepID=UPI000CE7E11E|nr:hypothetical protein [Rathayibacter sp. AY1H3]PPH07750.1 hypothetical protein C5C33_07055 [Rathayibacter sp. AY1H3]